MVAQLLYWMTELADQLASCESQNTRVTRTQLICWSKWGCGRLDMRLPPYGEQQKECRPHPFLQESGCKLHRSSRWRSRRHYFNLLGRKNKIKNVPPRRLHSIFCYTTSIRSTLFNNVRKADGRSQLSRNLAMPHHRPACRASMPLLRRSCL